MREDFNRFKAIQRSFWIATPYSNGLNEGTNNPTNKSQGKEISGISVRGDGYVRQRKGRKGGADRTTES